MNISVVIPTYERPELLERCLQALINQDFCRTEYEIIVVIDGADPQTEAMAGNYSGSGHEIRFICLEERKGPASARNRGWLRARGKLVAFTDDDCLPAINWLSELWRGYQNSGLADVAFTGKVSVPLPDVITDHVRNTRNLENCRFLTANCACTKSALFKTGGFDERFRMAWREDSDLEFKLIQQNIPILHLIKARVDHPVREASWDVSLREQKKGMYNALLYKKFPRLYKEKIGQKAPITYYLMLALTMLFVITAFIGAKEIAQISFVSWLLLVMAFATRRLNGTTLSVKALIATLITSALIPFHSLFWQWYGAAKFKVLFL